MLPLPHPPFVSELVHPPVIAFFANFVVDTISGVCYFLNQVRWLIFVPVAFHEL
jgi:hypothetical protein